MKTKIAIIFLTLFIVSCVKPEDKDAPKPDYVITGNATSGFTATIKRSRGKVVGTKNQPIQNVIDAIKIDAEGKDCAIQFGDGKSVLDLGNGYMLFDGGETGRYWGKISLLGKVTSEIYGGVVITLSNGVTIDSRADIVNTADGLGSYRGDAIYFSPESKKAVKLNIISGTIEAVSGAGIYFRAYVYDNYPIIPYNEINIKGGTVRTTGANGSAIVLSNMANGTLNISGGTVSAKGAECSAINNSGLSGVINISGGKISAEGISCVAFYNEGNAVANIDGGTISAKGYQCSAFYTWPYYYNDGGVININDGLISADGYNCVTFYDRNKESFVNIGGGKIESIGEKCVTFDCIGSIVLSGSPEIIGVISIDSYNSKKLNVTTDFKPQERIYTLLFDYDYRNGDNVVVVVNGAEFISNFTLIGSSAEYFILGVSGNDIICKEKSVNGVMPAPQMGQKEVRKSPRKLYIK
jgi:hypothetical protein